MERQVERWQVRAATEQLLARYAELIDDGDFAGIGALLAGAVITIDDGTVIARGEAAITRLYERSTRRYDDGTPHTQHQITNLIVEPDERPGRWIARSSFVVLQAVGELALQPIITGRYRDVVEVTAASPDRGPGPVVDPGPDVVFVERRMMPRLHGDLSSHLLIEMEPPVGP